MFKTEMGLFGIGDKINLEQVAVMMYRYAKYKGFDISEKAELDGFVDVYSVNAFVEEAMECAAIIMCFVEKYEM